MFNKLTSLIFILLLAGCSENKHEFWEISKFKMSDNALKEAEEVDLIYTSDGPGSNEDKEYYIHLIVVSKASGDTVNVLTPINNGFAREQGIKTYNFFGANSMVYKATQFKPEDMKDVTVEDIQKQQPKQISKVARDPQFDYLADNNHPTMIGMVAKFSGSEPK